jgi:AcrR family transcriptional regulator
MRFVLYFALLSAAVMGIKERKAKEKEDLKQLILDAALELLEREGFDGLSIRKIAERIEYAPATIYLYYRDKDQLLFELHNVGFARFMAKMSECLVEPTAAERLRVMGQKYIEFALDNPQLYHLMMVEREPIKEENLINFDGWEHGYKSLDLLRGQLAQAQAEGSLHTDNLDISTIVFWSAVHGTSMLYLSERLNMMPDEVRRPMLMAANDHFYQLVFGHRPTVTSTN